MPQSQCPEFHAKFMTGTLDQLSEKYCHLYESGKLKNIGSGSAQKQKQKYKNPQNTNLTMWAHGFWSSEDELTESEDAEKRVQSYNRMIGKK